MAQALEAIIQSPSTTFPPSFMSTYAISGVPTILDSTASGLLSPSQPPGSSTGKLTTAAIIGIAVGGGLGLIIVIVIIALLVARRRRAKGAHVHPGAEEAS